MKWPKRLKQINLHALVRIICFKKYSLFCFLQSFKNVVIGLTFKRRFKNWRLVFLYCVIRFSLKNRADILVTLFSRDSRFATCLRYTSFMIMTYLVDCLTTIFCQIVVLLLTTPSKVPDILATYTTLETVCVYEVPIPCDKELVIYFNYFHLEGSSVYCQ